VPLVPAHCQSCGLTWQPHGGIFIENSRNVTLRNGSTNCPRCGSTARFLEGTFNVRDDLIEVLSAPDWTREKFRELQGVLNWARLHLADDPEAVIARVSEVDRRVGGLLQSRLIAGWTRDDTWKLVMAILAAVAIVVSVMGQRGGLSEEDVRRIVEQEMEQYDLPNDPPGKGR
jgi:hypothetical protein